MMIVRHQLLLLIALLLAAVLHLPAVRGQEVAAASSREAAESTGGEGGAEAKGECVGEDGKKLERYQVAVFKWKEVQIPYTVALWILLASVAKNRFVHLKKTLTYVRTADFGIASTTHLQVFTCRRSLRTYFLTVHC